MLSLKPRVRSFWTVIDYNITEVVFREYFNSDVIIVKQAGGIQVAGKVIPTKKDDDSPYTFTTLFRGDIFKQVAEIIALNLNVDRPLYLYLTLQNFEAGVVMDLIDILGYVLGKYFIDSFYR